MAAAIDVPERFNAAAFFVDRHVAEGRGAPHRLPLRRPLGHLRARSPAAGAAARRARCARAASRSSSACCSRCDDRPAFAAAFWGASKLGAVPCPSTPLMRREEYAFLLDDSRARAAVVEPRRPRGVLGRARPAAARLRDRAGGRRGGGRAPTTSTSALGRATPVAEAAPTRSRRTSSTGATPPARPGGRRPPCTPTATSWRRPSWSARGIFGLGAGRPRLLGLQAVLRLRPRQHALLPGARRRRLRPRARAARRPSARSRSSPPSGRPSSSRCRRSTRACCRCPTPSGASISRRCASACPPARRCRRRSSTPGPSASAWSCVEVVGSTEALHDFIANRPGEARAGRRRAGCPRLRGAARGRRRARRCRPAPSATCCQGRRPPRRTTGTATSARAAHHAGRVAAHRRHVLPGRRRLLLLRRAAPTTC